MSGSVRSRIVRSAGRRSSRRSSRARSTRAARAQLGEQDRPRCPRGPSGARCRQSRRRRRPGTGRSARRGPRSSRRSRCRERRPAAVRLHRDARSPSSAPRRSRAAPRRGDSTPITSRMKSDPMTPNWSRLSARGIRRSRRRRSEGTSRRGPGAARRCPGRAMPRMRPMCSSDAASIAPVEPADTTASAEPSRTRRQAVTIEESGFARTAATGSSLEPITSGAVDDLDAVDAVSELRLELVADAAEQHAHALGGRLLARRRRSRRGRVAPHARRLRPSRSSGRPGLLRGFLPERLDLAAAVMAAVRGTRGAAAPARGTAGTRSATAPRCA